MRQQTQAALRTCSSVSPEMFARPQLVGPTSIPAISDDARLGDSFNCTGVSSHCRTEKAPIGFRGDPVRIGNRVINNTDYVFCMEEGDAGCHHKNRKKRQQMFDGFSSFPE